MPARLSDLLIGASKGRKTSGSPSRILRGSGRVSGNRQGLARLSSSGIRDIPPTPTGPASAWPYGYGSAKQPGK